MPIHSEDFEVTWLKALEEIRGWTRIERAEYADVKFTPTMRQQEIQNLIDNPNLEEYVHVFVGIHDYMKRAELFGLNTLKGRQALGKALITIESCLTGVTIAFGPMSEPGVPSGENCG